MEDSYAIIKPVNGIYAHVILGNSNFFLRKLNSKNGSCIVYVKYYCLCLLINWLLDFLICHSVQGSIGFFGQVGMLF